MEPVLVPGPPKTAFNMDRPISDLIRSQLAHFKHVEEKLPADVRATLPQDAIATEGEAARYIAAMTRLLRAKAAAAAMPAPIVMPRRAEPESGLALAAAAETDAAGAAKETASAAKKVRAPAKKKSGRKT